MVNHTRHKNNYARFLEVNGNRPQTTKEHLYDGLYKQEFKDATPSVPAPAPEEKPETNPGENEGLGTTEEMEEFKASALPVDEEKPAAEADEKPAPKAARGAKK